MFIHAFERRNTIWSLLCYWWYLRLCSIWKLLSFLLYILCLSHSENLPITNISQISITVKNWLFSPKHVDWNPVGRWLINTICRTSLLTVMFCIGAGQPDIGSWRYTRYSGSSDWGLNVSLKNAYIEKPEDRSRANKFKKVHYCVI